AEMSVDAARGVRLPGLLRPARGHLSRCRRMGAARRDRGAGGAALAGAVPRPYRRQVAGRIRHCRERQGAGAAGRAGAARRTGRAPLRRADRLGAGARGVSDTAIVAVHGRRVWDSRGRPTVEAELRLAGGAVGRAIPPAGALMAERGLLQGVADEGGFWPAFESNEAALDALLRAIERAGFTPGQEVAISLDIASSEFCEDGRYRLALDGRALDSDAMAEMLISWIDGYPIVSIEDPLAEHDAEGLRRFTPAVGERVQIVGDDCLGT